MRSYVLDGLAHITQDVVEAAAVRLQSIRIGLTSNWSCVWFISGSVDVGNEWVDAILRGVPVDFHGCLLPTSRGRIRNRMFPSTCQLGVQMWRRNSARLQRFKAREPTQLEAMGNTLRDFFLGEIVHVVEGTGPFLVSR